MFPVLLSKGMQYPTLHAVVHAGTLSLINSPPIPVAEATDPNNLAPAFQAFLDDVTVRIYQPCEFDSDSWI